MDILGSILAATIVAGTPLIIVALGQLIAEKSGVLNLGAEGMMAREEEIYLGFCTRWRQLPKPTIAQVQGKVIAGGLMLVWPCDLVVASEDATFSDPVVAFGVNGGEYFAHPWEVGARKAKEMLFTGEPLTAAQIALLKLWSRRLRSLISMLTWSCLLL